MKADLYKNLVVEIDGQVGYVTMNRPQRRNALSMEHMLELTSCFKQIGEDAQAGRNDVRAVILRGNGPGFCAGHDFSEMIGKDEAFYRRLLDVCTELMETIQAIPQPVIAQVHGIATAAGCQLVATCDLAIAEEGATFATSGVRYGLFCSTPMVAVTRNVGRKKAMEMLLTGEFISARDALAEGLVNKVVPVGELATATRALADKIAEMSPYVIAVGKQAFYRQIDVPQRQAYEHAKKAMLENALARDGQEGMCAFVEKRAPRWNGKP